MEFATLPSPLITSKSVYFIILSASRIPFYYLVALFHLQLSKTFRGSVTAVRTLRYIIVVVEKFRLVLFQVMVICWIG